MKKSVLLFTILFCHALNAFSQNRVEADEYEVYKVLLGEGKNLVSRFTIRNDGINYSMKLSHLKQELSSLQPQTLKNYKARNQKSVELQEKFGTKPTVILVAGNDISALLDKLGKNADELIVENALIEKYGSGTLIMLSRVGFNKNKTQALVGVYSNTGLCGTCRTNYYFILAKESGNWIITKKVISAIS